MYDFYTVLENIVIFLSKDVIFRIILPCIFIFLVFDIIRYMFSRDSKKEDIIDALKTKAIGFTVLILLPFIMLWFISFIGKVTGAEVDVDTSVITKLIGTNKITSSTASPE